jgi:hypothetical protein
MLQPQDVSAPIGQLECVGCEDAHLEFGATLSPICAPQAAATHGSTHETFEDEDSVAGEIVGNTKMAEESQHSQQLWF